MVWKYQNETGMSTDISNDMRKITGAQLRAARSLIRWRAEDLALRSGVGVATIRRAELSDGEVGMTLPNATAVQRALETAGVIFVAENGEGPGVRLRKESAARAVNDGSNDQ
jgi:transcriptional regulator with XRE-family HTH domain